MNRIIAALPLLALAACAQPSRINPQDPRIPEAEQVYQSLKLVQVEQQMLSDDHRLTYGYAVVNCGLRPQEWMDMLQNVYAQDYEAELQRHPLTPEQQAQARAFAEAHVSNPSPPPYLCMRLSKDSALTDLDYSIGMESLLIASQKKKKEG